MCYAHQQQLSNLNRFKNWNEIKDYVTNQEEYLTNT